MTISREPHNQAPASAAPERASPDPAAAQLPSTDRDAIRQSLLSNPSTPASQSRSPGTESTPSATPLQTPQVLITIIRQTTQQPLNPDAVGRLQPGVDPLIDAIRRLGSYGALPALDGRAYILAGQVGAVTPPSVATSPSAAVPRAPEPRQPQLREPRPTEEGKAVDTSPRGPSEREAVSRDTETKKQPEPQAEQRLREVLEKAIQRFKESGLDIPVLPERSAPLPPGAVTTPEAPSLRPLQPTEQRDQARNNPETILSPSIRDTLNDPRNDIARVVQQILAIDPTPGRQEPLQPLPLAPETSAVLAIHPLLAQTRSSVQERLTQLRDGLQVTIERSSPQPAAPQDQFPRPSQATNQVGDFNRVEPVRHHSAPTASIHSAERSAPQDRGIPNALPPQPGSGALRPVGDNPALRTSNTAEQATSLLDALTKATQRLVSLQSLRKIEYAAETAVITCAAAIVLGVMGSEILLKQLLALSHEILRRLRDERGAHNEDTETEDLRAMVLELERELNERAIEGTTQPAGLVADIPGAVKDDATGFPLQGVTIDGGTLGVTITNAKGEFIFKNIPVNTGFAIIARADGYTFFPCPAIGTVSPSNTYITLFARKE